MRRLNLPNTQPSPTQARTTHGESAPTVRPSRGEPRLIPFDRLVDRPAGLDMPDDTARRKVLIIASRFPPVASVGATRVRKFVKYLREFGWEPIVLTGAMRGGHARTNDPRLTADPRRAADLDSLADIPTGIDVVRLPAWCDHWPSLAARALSRPLSVMTALLDMDAARVRAGLKWRFDKWHDRLAFPDRGIFRIASALRAAMALHRRHRFDAIFSTGMPFSDHLIALAVQAVIRRPWLADFRDPWVEYVHWQQWRGDRGRRVTEWTEAAVIRRAARVVSVNDAMTRRFQARYPRRFADRFVTIENGYDPTDFPPARDSRPRTEFRLLYAGSLYGARKPDAVLAAFRQFVDHTPGARQHARFDFAGRPGPHVAALQQPADGDTVRYLGLLPHREAMRATAEADVNVVILPDIPGGEIDSTAKIYECLGSGRPVLAAVPNQGAAAQLLSQFDGVALCPPGDIDAIAAAIGRLYHDWLNGHDAPRRGPAQLAGLTRRHQTQRLADLLDQTLAARRTRSGDLR